MQPSIGKKRQKLNITFLTQNMLLCSTGTTFLLFHHKQKKRNKTLYEGIVYRYISGKGEHWSLIRRDSGKSSGP